jgi:hypothetical protein
MKNYIIILATLLSIISCKAQITPQRTITFSEKLSDDFAHQNGDYYIDNENKLNTFEGIWVYNDGNGKKLTLNIRKKNQLLLEDPMIQNQYQFEDMLIITYKLEINGNILHDNLTAPLPVKMLGIYGGFYSYFTFYQPNYLKTEGTFHDANYNIIANATITKITTLVGQPEKILFHLFGASRKNDPSFYNGLIDAFCVPNNVELTKL